MPHHVTCHGRLELAEGISGQAGLKLLRLVRVLNRTPELNVGIQGGMLFFSAWNARMSRVGNELVFPDPKNYHYEEVHARLCTTSYQR
jgi:hypothetical protein